MRVANSRQEPRVHIVGSEMPFTGCLGDILSWNGGGSSTVAAAFLHSLFVCLQVTAS